MAARIVCFFPLSLLLLFVSAGMPLADAALITSFQGAFQTPTPAPGWSYVWNNGGAIGAAANYTPLLASPGGRYTSDGTDVFPAAAPAGFVGFSLSGVSLVPGGHPGLGTSEAGSGGIERYTIAVYTLASPETIAIQNGLLRNINPNSGGSTDGLNLKIYVNNNPVFSDVTAPGVGSQLTFAAQLGLLNAGDKIYVAIGGKNTAAFDSFILQYDITAVPEPGGALLFVFAALLIGIAAKRRSKC
jgi:hypothetical protein